MCDKQDLCQQLFEKAAEALLVIQENQIVDANARAAALFGCPKDTLLNQTLLHFSPLAQPDGSNSAEMLAEKTAAALAGQCQRFEWLCQASTGETVFTEMVLSGVELKGEVYLMVSIQDISRYKQAEAELLRERNLLRSLIDNLPDTNAFIKDTASRFIFTNVAHLNVIGVDRLDQVLGKTDFEFFPQELAEQYFANEQTIMRSGQPLLNLVEPAVDSTGHKKWYLTNKLPLYDKNNKVIGLVGMSLDITKRKEAEESLRESQQLLQVVMDNIPQSIFWKDSNLTYLGCNRAFAEDAALPSPEAIIGKTDYEMVWREQADLYRADDRRVMEMGQPKLNYEEPQTTAAGTQTWLRTSKVPIHDAEGNIVTVLGMYEDITQQKQAEEALRNSRQMLQTVLEHFPGVVFWKDSQSVYLGCNKAFANAAGLADPSEIIDKTDYDLPWAATEATIYQADDRAVMESRLGRIGIIESQHQADGRVAWFETSKIPLMDTTGKVIGLLGTSTDVTERKQLEQKVSMAAEQRARQIRASVLVAQEVVGVTSLEELYQRIVSRINGQYGFYHTQLFRYQPNTELLTGVADDGEAGKQVFIGEHLGLGEGLVGLAAATGGPILRPDVSLIPNWHAQPLLPHTQGELAIPITLGGEDPQVQVAILQNFIKFGFDGFVVTPLDIQAVGSVGQAAIRKGKSLVTVGVDLGEQNQTALVLSSDHEMGYLLGQQASNWAKEHIPAGETPKIGLLTYLNPLGQLIQRENAIIEALKEGLADNFTLIQHKVPGSPAPGLSDWLNEHPDMRMILGLTDGLALDAYQAVITAGKNEASHFFIGGVDALPEALTAIKAGGAFQATVTQPAREMGSLAVRTLVAAIKNLPYKKFNPIVHTPVNPTNIDQFLGAASLLSDQETSEDIFAGLELSQIKIGFAVLNLTNPFFVAMAAGAREEAERLGVQLFVGDPKRILGVLDVQSREANALNVEDQLALEGLCAQIAAAIESAQLRQEMEDRLQELNALQRLMSREGWQAFQSLRQQSTPAYLFDQISLRSATAAEVGLTSQGNGLKEVVGHSSPRNGSVIARPLTVHGEFIGALGIQDDTDNPLTSEDQAFLDAVTEQVAEALERSRLLEQTQKRAVEMEIVAQVSAVVSTILDTKELLQEVADLTKERFALYHAHIYLLNETGDTLQLVAGAGEIGRRMVTQGWSIPLSREHSLVARAGREHQGIIVNDVRQAPDFMPNPLLPDTRAELAIPLLAGDTVLGVLDVQSAVAGRFSDQDVQIKTTLASQVAVALQNARQYQQTQSALAKTETLYQVAEALGQMDDEQAMFEFVLTAYLQTLNLSQGGVLIINEDDPYYGTLKALMVKGQLVKPGARVPMQGNPASDKVITTRKPVVISDALNDPLLENTQDFVQQMGYKSLLLVPIVVRGKVIGILGADSVETIHEFTEPEISLVQAMADQLGIALENRRLLDETQAALAEVERTQRRYTVQAWETYRDRLTTLSYEQVREGVDNLLPETTQAMTDRQVVTGDEPSGLISSTPTHEPNPGLIVPLTVRGEAIGVLGLQETDEQRVWLPEEIALIEAICEQLAQAAENIRLIDESQQRAARERRVNEIGEKIQAAQSLEEALQIAVKEVGLSLQAPQTIVKLDVK